MKFCLGLLPSPNAPPTVLEQTFWEHMVVGMVEAIPEQAAMRRGPSLISLITT
jgi:hypothetical protein